MTNYCAAVENVLPLVPRELVPLAILSADRDGGKAKEVLKAVALPGEATPAQLATFAAAAKSLWVEFKEVQREAQMRFNAAVAM